MTFTISDASETQKGVIETSTDAESIAGTSSNVAVVPSSLTAKLGLQTSHGIAIGAGTTSALYYTAELSDGQLIIGSTGNYPSLGSLASAGGTITVTLGAGTINLEAAGIVPIEFDTDAGNAVPALGILNVIGGDNITSAGAGNTVTVAVSGTTASCVQVGNVAGSLTSIGAGTTGQLLIGATGADPAFGNIAFGNFSFSNLTPATPRSLTVSNADGDVASYADVRISTPAGGGDSMISWEVSGGAGPFYALGVDNSDGDKWKLTNSSDPSSGDALLTMTNAGYLTLYNNLDVTEGGTGVSTFTQYGVLVGNAGSDIQVTAAGATGTVLIGTNGANPSFSATPTVTTLTTGTVQSTAALNLTPTAGSAVVIDGHWSFDGPVMTAITDNNTVLTAFAGKNITIEGLKIDGTDVTAATEITFTATGLPVTVISTNAGTFNLARGLAIGLKSGSAADSDSLCINWDGTNHVAVINSYSGATYAGAYRPINMCTAATCTLNLGSIRTTADTSKLRVTGTTSLDNINVATNTISSTTGNINITPIAGSAIVFDSYWSLDNNTITTTAGVINFITTGETAINMGLSNIVTSAGAADVQIAIGSSNNITQQYAIALGYSNETTSGGGGFGIGYDNTANGYTTAIGYGNNAGAYTYCSLIGRGNTAGNNNCYALGRDCITGESTKSGLSVAIGYEPQSLATYGIAIGYQAVVGKDNDGGFAIGRQATTSATGTYCQALGYLSNASGTYATALGKSTTASGTSSLAIGTSSTASHNNSFVWSDSSARSSSAANEVTFGAAGGFRILGGGLTVATTITASAGDITATAGHVKIAGAGKQLQIEGGAVTDFIGQLTLETGTKTINNTNIADTDKIMLSRQSVNGSTAIGALTYTITAATSFTVTSVQMASPGTTETNDVSIIDYFIVRQL